MHFLTPVIIIPRVHFRPVGWVTRAGKIIIRLRQIHLGDRRQQSLLNFFWFVKYFDEFPVLRFGINVLWGRNARPKLQVTVYRIRGNVRKSAASIQTFCFLQKFMTRMYHSDSKSRSFHLLLSATAPYFTPANCASRDLIFPPHLSFFLIRIRRPHCLFDRQPHSIRGARRVWGLKGKVNIHKWGHTIVHICKFITRGLW